MIYKRIILFGIFLILALASCSQKTQVPVELVTSHPQIEQVTVDSTAAEGWVVRVTGLLADGCTRLGDPGVSRAGGLVAIIIPAYRSTADRDCTGAQPFERTFSLGSDLTPGHYLVSVNGVEATFDVMETSAAAASPLPEAQPDTATPTEPPGAPRELTAGQSVGVEAGAGSQDQTGMVEKAPAEDSTGDSVDTTGDSSAGEVTTSTGQVGSAPVDDSADRNPADQNPADQNPAAEPAACEIKAAFFSDVTVPDGTFFNPGETFTKTWRIRNVGSCTWQEYSLQFQGGDALGSEAAVPVPGTVEPGATVDISINFKAPLAPGPYYSDWLLATPDGKVFGLGNPSVGLLWTRIGVRAASGETGNPPAGGIPVTGTGPVEKTCAYLTDPAYEAEILTLINAVRVENELEPLQLVELASTAARMHSADMACKDFVDHYGSNGSTWYTRLQTQGVAYRKASENIYSGNPDFGGTPQGAFTWWMNSQVHRMNILNPKFKQVGVGYVYYGPSTYKGYYTLNLMMP